MYPYLTPIYLLSQINKLWKYQVTRVLKVEHLGRSFLLPFSENLTCQRWCDMDPGQTLSRTPSPLFCWLRGSSSMCWCEGSDIDMSPCHHGSQIWKHFFLIADPPTPSLACFLRCRQQRHLLGPTKKHPGEPLCSKNNQNRSNRFTGEELQTHAHEFYKDCTCVYLREFLS